MSSQKIQYGSVSEIVFDENFNLSRAQDLKDRPEEVLQRAIDIADNGQTQPIRCFLKRAGGKPHAYIGFTRGAAIALINTGFEYDTGEKKKSIIKDEAGNETEGPEEAVIRRIHNPELQVAYVVDDDLTEEQATIRGLADNFQTNQPNDVDLAHAVVELQKRYSYTDAKVTKLLNVSDPYKVGRVKKLLSTPAFVQEAVRTGNLATATALEIVNTDNADAKKAATDFVKAELKEGRKPTTNAVRTVVENNTPDEKGNLPTPETKRPVPTGSAIRAYFSAMATETENDDDLSDEYKGVLREINRWVSGQIKEKTLTKNLDEVFGVKAKPKARKPRTVETPAEGEPVTA